MNETGEEDYDQNLVDNDVVTITTRDLSNVIKYLKKQPNINRTVEDLQKCIDFLLEKKETEIVLPNNPFWERFLRAAEDARSNEKMTVSRARIKRLPSGNSLTMMMS